MQDIMRKDAGVDLTFPVIFYSSVTVNIPTATSLILALRIVIK
ncbi:hypothetical protein Pse7429DRAFT_4332 [Pseudanabaena biceps PCC 7429]|uniref:Uncharacterized protein n=1 Tax=Pseudanabaena biceps PCC 7429 TaxID=927668 RepID=L8MVR7_9CYAN|nr:hypothetical protein Pse7429DRAFT_4332 [Pseudanabaena biceps PCC 7429]